MANLINNRFIFKELKPLEIIAKKPRWYKVIFDSPETFMEKFFLKREFLASSAFYPCSWGDDRPIDLLAGYIYSFIYCDINYGGCVNGKPSYRVIIDQLGHEFGSYRCIYANAVPLEDLTKENFEQMNRDVFKKEAGGWEEFSFEEPSAVFSLWKRRLERFRRISPFLPMYIAITFVKAEACHFYYRFYTLNKLVPKVIFDINPGMSLIHNVSFDWDSEFLKVMRKNSAGWPPFLLSPDFPHFPLIIRDVMKYKYYRKNMKNLLNDLKAFKDIPTLNHIEKIKDLSKFMNGRGVINLVKFLQIFERPKGVNGGPFGISNSFYYSPAPQFCLYHFPFSGENSWKYLIEFLKLKKKREQNLKEESRREFYDHYMDDERWIIKEDLINDESSDEEESNCFEGDLNQDENLIGGSSLDDDEIRDS